MSELILVTVLIGTSYKDVQSIFEKRCSQCHNANWPQKNWMDEKIAKANAPMIKFRVETQNMPPGNMSGITKEERQKVIDWVNGGAK